MNQQWKCPTCGNKLTTYVKLSEQPTCTNKGTHSTTAMEQTNKKGKQDETRK